MRRCRRFVIAGGDVAGVARRGDRAHYTGLQTCGSVWSCPVCSAKIQAERSDELVQAVERAHSLGLKIAMGTLTMRHRRGRRLLPMWAALSDAFAAAMGRDRAVRRAKKSLGCVGWVRRVEATHGRNGWHLHAHALILYRGGELRELDDAMWSAWLRRLRAHGLDAEREYGIELRELNLDQARDEVGRYLSKGVYEHTSGSAARELAGQLGKTGRNGNRTPFDVLADLTRDGLVSDLAIWSEWERASKGRRALTWSKGLREQLLVDDVERTDEELAAENDGDQVPVVRFDGATWTAIVAKRLEVELLEVIESVTIEESYDAAAAFMRAHGLGEPWRPRRE